jgi:hypothetical protein
MGRRLPLLAIAALALAGATSGCSGTPFGDQLARSFSAPSPGASPLAQPAAAPAQQDKAGLDQTKPGSVQSGPAQPGPVQSSSAQSGSAQSDQARSAAAKPVRPQPAAPPAPYRITLRLPGADPSAPAEAVTEALRAAGVRFEVEMIERVGAGATAPTAAPSVAPTVTPAPAPR